ncbi:unnamed protein product [Penicillium roqueforti FM164]|uniref:Genomic scaffold, ProqFM164S02 n=1 Tax=Penicillium roqueforti (strain FM164) TaxID=1365484 RepID=W6Q8H5_PENRF|nr:unnamed protein product [Penicillium roqueforti FM164]
MVYNTSSAIRTKSAPIDTYSTALFNFNHYKYYLDNLNPQCGLLTFRSTLITLGFCPFYLGDKRSAVSLATVFCPHLYCEERKYINNLYLQWHFFDIHSIEEPQSNCIKRKRKWQLQSEPAGTTFRNLSNETLPSLEDYFLTNTLPTSFKDSDITSADNLFMEFIHLDDD